MSVYAIKRLAQLIPTVLGIVTLVFLMLRMLPGDPAAYIAGENIGQEALDAVRAKLGLDQPLGMQYVTYLVHVMRFDLGRSILTSLPVSNMVMAAVPVTLLIGTVSLLIGFVISVPLGTIAAYMAS